jgi:oligosaccharide repeat unit polymerase
VPVENFPPIILMLGLAFFSFSFSKCWFYPGAIYPFFWTIGCLAPLLAPLEVWSGALWWIALSSTVMCVGCFLGFNLGLPKRSLKSSFDENQNITLWRPRLVLFSCFSLGLSYVVYVQSSGVNIGLADHKLPLASKPFLAFLYCGPLIGGIIYGSNILPSKMRWLTILPMVPPAALAVLFTGRSNILQPILYWVSGYFSYRVYLTHGKVALFRIRNILTAFLFLLLFIVIGMGLNMLRGARSDVNVISFDDKVDAYLAYTNWDEFFLRWDRFRYLAFGNVAFFSGYFETAWDFPPELQYGAIIFAGPLKVLGVRPRTTFEKQDVADGVDPNVYTGFRLPIDDFGLAGSFFWWFLYGGVLGFSYARVVHARRPVYCIFLISCYIDLVLFGGFFFRYNSIILSYLISIWYLYWSTKMSAREEFRRVV